MDLRSVLGNSVVGPREPFARVKGDGGRARMAGATGSDWDALCFAKRSTRCIACSVGYSYTTVKLLDV